MVKIISWNVNGIRASLKKGFLDFVEEHKPDILCLQETKTPGDAVDVSLDHYFQSWNHARKKGYSGTAIFSKKEPISVKEDMGIVKHDQEGRVLAAEYKDYYVISVYVPNAKRSLERLPYRVKEWDVDFLKYLKKLEKKKPVIFCGDLNVAHSEIDLANPKGNKKSHGFTDEERAGFSKFLTSGFLDTFREKHKEAGHYSWWSQFNNCRGRNIGWRVDYICASSILKSKIKSSSILKDVMGSDHCPVELVLKG